MHTRAKATMSPHAPTHPGIAAMIPRQGRGCRHARRTDGVRRHSLRRDVKRQLCQLHARDVVPGDPPEPNVPTMPDGKAFLIDFDWRGKVDEAQYPSGEPLLDRWHVCPSTRACDMETRSTIVPGQPIAPEGGEPRRVPAQGRTCVLLHHWAKVSSLSAVSRAGRPCLCGLILYLALEPYFEPQVVLLVGSGGGERRWGRRRSSRLRSRGRLPGQTETASKGKLPTSVQVKLDLLKIPNVPERRGRDEILRICLGRRLGM